MEKDEMANALSEQLLATFTRWKVKRNQRVDLLIFDVYRDGHRRDYFRVLRRVLRGHVIHGPFTSHWPVLLRARIVVCSTCDDYLTKFFLLSVARAILNRTTVGLAVRAETIFQRAGLAQIIKRALFRMLKLIPKADLVTFMPYWVEPRLKEFTSDWMYDIQYWDLPWLSTSTSLSLNALGVHLRQRAAGRRILMAVGHQRQVKGVEYCMQIFCSQAEVRDQYLFSCIGPNWDVDRQLVSRFVACGGVFVDRPLRDDEVVPTYALSDLIWVCYRPDYDQSSGIFGRAIQLNRPTVVREGSYLAMLQERFDDGGLSIPYDQAEAAAAALLKLANCGDARMLSKPDRGSEYLCNLLNIEPRRPL